MSFSKKCCFYLVLTLALCSCDQQNGLKKLQNGKPSPNKENTKVHTTSKTDSASDQKESNQSKILSLPTATKAMSLPHSLREISGLTYDASANDLVAHNDELGILYRIDFENKEILSEEKIANIGDYEGVEKVGDMIYLINSAGGIIAHHVIDKENEKLTTGLNASNNVEGLGYYNDQLLIACKAKPEIDPNQNFPDCRAIYSYSLKTKSLSKDPFMLISKKMLHTFVGATSQDKKERLNKFAPSGIAVHPKTKEIYILSHKGKMLVVCNAQTVIQKLYFLNKEEHRQPEGICFDDQNRLYLANESKEGPAMIYQYSIN